MRLELVHPDNLRSHWPRILSSLCAVRAKASDDWIAEDVYHAIKAGHAACHVA
jgi:Mor family transcriptional regulator